MAIVQRYRFADHAIPQVRNREPRPPGPLRGSLFLVLVRTRMLGDPIPPEMNEGCEGNEFSKRIQ